MMGIRLIWCRGGLRTVAKIAQLGERMTEDHKVRCSIHLLGAFFFFDRRCVLVEEAAGILFCETAMWMKQAKHD